MTLTIDGRIEAVESETSSLFDVNSNVVIEIGMRPQFIPLSVSLFLFFVLHFISLLPLSSLKPKKSESEN